MTPRQGFRVFRYIQILVLLMLAEGAAVAQTATVEIINPTNGATVSGLVNVAVRTSAKVAQIHIVIDDRRAHTKHPRNFMWNASDVTDGIHTIAAKAYAKNGAYLSSSKVQVKVSRHQNSAVILTSPANGSTVQGAVTIAASISGSVTWINIYIDGNYWTSSPPYSFNWNSASVPNGKHMISANAYKSGGVLLGQSSVTVNVQNNVSSPTPSPSSTPSATPSALVTPTATSTITGTPTPTAIPTRTATPTVIATATATVAPTKTVTPTASIAPTATATSTPSSAATPSATPTPNGLTYYVDSVNGSDANNGTTPSSAWRSLSKVQSMIGNIKPGISILFARGDTWSGGLELTGLNGTATAPIVFGNYGSGALPVFDGGSSSEYGFHASSGSHVTIDGFEIRNFTYNGVSIHSSGGTMPGWTVQNCNIHNTGPGAYAGGGGPYDDGGYRNQLEFLDFSYSCDGTSFLDNQVSVCGGHNCVQIHGDTCSPRIHGNTVVGPWDHNAIDVKAVVGAVVDGNIVDGGANGACYYIENTQIPAADVTWMEDVCYAANSGFECEGGGVSGHAVTCHLYNNTNYQTNQEAVVTGDGCTQPITWDIRNNIFDTGKDIVYMPSASCSNRMVTWDYNDDCGSMGTCSSLFQGPHDLDGVNPDYVDAAGSPPDFHLQAISPLIGAGELGLTPGDDDIGAY
jgi:hypothetical protein